MVLARILTSIRSPHRERALQALYGAASNAQCCSSPWSTRVAGCSCSQTLSSCQEVPSAAHQCCQYAQPPHSFPAGPPSTPLPWQWLLPGPHSYQSAQPNTSNRCSHQLVHSRSQRSNQHRHAVASQPSTVATLQQQHLTQHPALRGGWHRHISSSAPSAMCSSTGASTDPSNPAAGSSSSAAEPQVLAKIEPRIAMVYTCTKCDTRSVKTFSRRSYEKGLVLVRCPGCNKLHLVADHLGWFGEKGWTIQDLEAEKGISVKVVQAPPNLTSPPSSQSDGNAATAAGLTLEDWVGWSRVEQLLEEVQHEQQGKGASQSSDMPAAEQLGAAGVAGSTRQKGRISGTSDRGAQQTLSDAQGVVEVGPMDLERWRKVRDTAE